MTRSAPEGLRIARLPRWLRPPAVLLRRALPERVVRWLPTAYAYQSDGMATAHHSPFLDDEAFNRSYWSIAERWSGGRQDVRWRVWVLTSCARHCRGLPGAFAEFGVYRGATAFMVLSQAGLGSGQTLHLFDTFAGIPPSHLSRSEVDAGLSGRLSDTSADEVAALLEPWSDQIALVVGELHDTVRRTETGPLAFAHLDLNAASATAVALSYCYPRLVAGGMVVFDDYGWRGYAEQRHVIDEFFAGKSETLIPLPTGQAIMVKL